MKVAIALLTVLVAASLLPGQAAAAREDARLVVALRLGGGPGRSVNASVAVGPSGRGRGTVRYVDRGLGLRMRSEQLESVRIADDEAVVVGRATVDRAPGQPFRLVVREEAGPGRPRVTLEVGRYRVESEALGTARLTEAGAAARGRRAPAPRPADDATVMASLLSSLEVATADAGGPVDRAAPPDRPAGPAPEVAPPTGPDGDWTPHLDLDRLAARLAAAATGLMPPDPADWPVGGAVRPRPVGWEEAAPSLASSRFGQLALRFFDAVDRAQRHRDDPPPPWQVPYPVLTPIARLAGELAISYGTTDARGRTVVSDGGLIHVLSRLGGDEPTTRDLRAADAASDAGIELPRGVALAIVNPDGTLGPLDRASSAAARRAAIGALRVARDLLPGETAATAATPGQPPREVVVVVSGATDDPAASPIATLLEGALVAAAPREAQARPEPARPSAPPLAAPPPALASSVPTAVPIEAAPLHPDVDVPGGRFYRQAGGDGRRGYAVTDADGVRLWTELRRLGGVAVLGYPASSRFEWDGYTVQVFQRAILQWRPERGEAVLVDLFDLLGRGGLDDWLWQRWQIPRRRAELGEGRPWSQVAAEQLAVLGRRPALRDAYFGASGDPLVLLGLPTSDVVDMGSHYALRTQRAVLQEWKTAVSWAGPGQVTVALGGDIAKEAGILPDQAALRPTLWPEPAPTAQP